MDNQKWMDDALPVAIGIVFVLLFSLICGKLWASEIPKTRFVNVIIGEACGESYEGKLAVACAIRARGSLRGVMGETSRLVRTHGYTTKAFVDSVRAYEESAYPKNCAFVNGATGWGNAKDVELFKKHKWWGKCRIVAVIGKHFFYKEVK